MIAAALCVDAEGDVAAGVRADSVLEWEAVDAAEGRSAIGTTSVIGTPAGASTIVTPPSVGAKSARSGAGLVLDKATSVDADTNDGASARGESDPAAADEGDTEVVVTDCVTGGVIADGDGVACVIVEVTVRAGAVVVAATAAAASAAAAAAAACVAGCGAGPAAKERCERRLELCREDAHSNASS